MLVVEILDLKLYIFYKKERPLKFENLTIKFQKNVSKHEVVRTFKGFE